MKKLLLLLIGLFVAVNCLGAVYYADVASGGGNDGSTWANAFNLAELDVLLEAGGSYDIAAGDILYIRGGTYTLTEAMGDATQDGTATSIIKIIGVKSSTTNEPPVLSDHAFGDDRPLFACTSYDFVTGDYYHVQNLRLTSTTTSTINISAGSTIYNCKSTNSSIADYCRAIYAGSASNVLYCEATASHSLGRGIYCSDYTTVVGCYVHDCNGGANAKGITTINSGVVIVDSIIDTCGIGIDLDVNVGVTVIGNTITACTTGILGNTASRCVILNNIIDSCTTDASWTTQTDCNWWDYNCWDGTPTKTNVTNGLNAIESAVTVTDNTFKVSSGSVVLDAALQVDSNTGITGDLKKNVGADQEDYSASGGGRSAGANLGGELQE